MASRTNWNNQHTRYGGTGAYRTYSRSFREHIESPRAHPTRDLPARRLKAGEDGDSHRGYMYVFLQIMLHFTSNATNRKDDCWCIVAQGQLFPLFRGERRSC